MKLTSSNVQHVYLDCLVSHTNPGDGETTTPDIHGVIHRAKFWQSKIDENADDINDLLDQLPAGFHAGEGGGWSFLQACIDRDDEHWGEHLHMEMLFLLGLAIGRVREPEPFASMRGSLPGGMPYYVIDGRTR